MRQVIIALGLCVSFAASAAPGPHLRWDACLGEAAARTNRTFACDVSTETIALVGSYSVADTLADIIGVEIVIDLATASPTLPAWWDLFNVGSCRPTALNVRFQRDPAWTMCAQRTELASSAGGIAAYWTSSTPGSPVSTPNRARIFIGQGVADSAAYSVNPASGESFAFALLMNSEHTTGPGACDGCTIPVCLAFVRLRLSADRGARLVDYNGIQNADADWYVTWQGPSTPPGGCPGSTPVRNTTWGRLKALYR